MTRCSLEMMDGSAVEAEVVGVDPIRRPKGRSAAKRTGTGLARVLFGLGMVAKRVVGVDTLPAGIFARRAVENRCYTKVRSAVRMTSRPGESWRIR